MLIFVLLLSSLALAEEVKVGVIFSMTGMASAFGQMTKEGLDLAYALKPEVLGKR